MGLLKKIFTFFAWVFAAFIGLFFFATLGMIVVAFSGGLSDEGLGGLEIKTDHAVGLVELSGEIISSDKFRSSLGKLAKNDKVKAVVVRIESPGGSVGASEEIFRAIKDVDQKKPVVCSLGNVAASGGLYSAVGCRKVVANKGTLTGSIGVILMMPNMSSLMDRFGVTMNIIKSGRFKDSGSPFRTMDTEERALLQTLINQSYEQFVDAIAESRGLDADVVKRFADGRIILGEQAVELGIVDEIGGPKRAAKLALELTGDAESEPEVVKLPKPTGLRALFADVSEARLVHWLASIGKLRLLYQAYL